MQTLRRCTLIRKGLCRSTSRRCDIMAATTSLCRVSLWHWVCSTISSAYTGGLILARSPGRIALLCAACRIFLGHLQLPASNPANIHEG